MTERRCEATRALIQAQQEYFDAMESRRRVAYPPASRVVFIGPHPDDIVLGCGGTVAAYVEAGVPTGFVCLTDGRACVAEPADREAMARVRGAEEREAARRLGVDDVELLAVPEDRLTDPGCLDRWAGQLGPALTARRPDAIFIPFWLELHSLHRHANHLLAEVIERHDISATIYAYQVVSLVPPAWVVDISARLERKVEAVEAYTSQLRVRDYRADMRLLGALHAPLVGPSCVAAEVFLGCPSGDYRARIAGLALDRPETLACGAAPVPEAGGPDR